MTVIIYPVIYLDYGNIYIYVAFSIKKYLFSEVCINGHLFKFFVKLSFLSISLSLRDRADTICHHFSPLSDLSEQSFGKNGLNVTS